MPRRLPERYIVGREQLEKVKDLTLFYPCSGRDLSVPIKIFSPYVTDFWFVDCNYFSQNTPADKQQPVLDRNRCYELLSKNIEGPPAWPSHEADITPCILTETYRHLKTGRIIRVHRRRGYGFSTLRFEKRMGKLGVFFYRGDSQGEGGSGNHWLKQEHLDEIFAKLINGGLLVLDGSDGRPYYRKRKGIYKEICKYARDEDQHLPNNPEELLASMSTVVDNKGRKYSCVGYAGRKYEPTMIWQVEYPPGVIIPPPDISRLVTTSRRRQRLPKNGR